MTALCGNVVKELLMVLGKATKMNNDLGEGGNLLVKHSKKMRIIDSSEDPTLMAIFEAEPSQGEDANHATLEVYPLIFQNLSINTFNGIDTVARDMSDDTIIELGDLRRNVLEVDTALKARAEQTKLATRHSPSNLLRLSGWAEEKQGN
ncbi:hypothetical protein E2542_SST17101 [Spatholobus suberectus]|nr:hypothetical protein E2542_SST17101 [Spatholobus suberectus]